MRLPAHRWDKKAYMIWRTAWGLLVAPVVGPPIAVYILILLHEGVTGALKVEAAFYVTVIAINGPFFMGWPSALIFGLPAHLFFLKRGWIKIYHYIGLGAVIGYISSFVWFFAFELIDRNLYGSTPGLDSTTMGYILMGSVTGLFFWLIVFWRNKYFLVPSKNIVQSSGD